MMMHVMRQENRIKPFMSIKDAAEAVGISEGFLRKMHRDGKLPGFYTGNKFNVDGASLVKKLRERSKVD